ncbi:hypothetical protein [Rhizobium sp. NPDC090279]|uniref:hypothetical protein n=1 Tax=Rhizobium sp. NPDC090279 TaxID=3364499 RepID=UPI00383AD177
MTALDDKTTHYVIYDTDGRIRQHGNCAESVLPRFAMLFGRGYSAMAVTAGQYRFDIDATSYVLDGVITPKGVALNVTEYTVQANGVDAVHFSVPAGTSVIHAGDIIPIEDNIFEFATDVLGDHPFSFIAPAAFYHFEVTIHAV